MGRDFSDVCELPLLRQFRYSCQIPLDVGLEVAPEGVVPPYSPERVPFPIRAISHCGLRFPLDELWVSFFHCTHLAPSQITLNSYRVLSALVVLNQRVGVPHDVYIGLPELFYCYNICAQHTAAGEAKRYFLTKKKTGPQFVGDRPDKDDSVDYIIVDGEYGGRTPNFRMPPGTSEITDEVRGVLRDIAKRFNPKAIRLIETYPGRSCRNLFCGDFRYTSRLDRKALRRVEQSLASSTGSELLRGEDRPACSSRASSPDPAPSALALVCRYDGDASIDLQFSDAPAPRPPLTEQEQDEVLSGMSYRGRFVKNLVPVMDDDLESPEGPLASPAAPPPEPSQSAAGGLVPQANSPLFVEDPPSGDDLSPGDPHSPLVSHKRSRDGFVTASTESNSDLFIIDPPEKRPRLFGPLAQVDVAGASGSSVPVSLPSNRGTELEALKAPEWKPSLLVSGRALRETDSVRVPSVALALGKALMSPADLEKCRSCSPDVFVRNSVAHAAMVYQSAVYKQELWENRRKELRELRMDYQEAVQKRDDATTGQQKLLRECERLRTDNEAKAKRMAEMEDAVARLAEYARVNDALRCDYESRCAENEALARRVAEADSVKARLEELESVTGGLEGWEAMEAAAFDNGWNTAEGCYKVQVDAAAKTWFVTGFLSGHQKAGGPPIPKKDVPLPDFEALRVAADARAREEERRAAEEAKQKVAAEEAAANTQLSVEPQ